MCHRGCVFTVRIRPDLASESISSGIERLLGVSPSDVQSDFTTLLDLLDAEGHATLARVIDKAHPGDEVSLDLAWHSDSRGKVWTRCTIGTRMRDDGTVVLEGTAVDITDMQRSIDLLNRRLGLLAENCCDVVWTQSADGTVSYITDAIERTRGMTRESALKQSIADMHTPASAARLTDYVHVLFEALAAGTQLPVFDGEQEYYRADGSIMFGELKILPHVDHEGHFVETLGIVRDISARKAREAELDRLASLDPLTGLWNRRRGEEQIAEEILNRRPGIPISLLLLDVDHFKTANDTNGHRVGDLLLIQIAEHLHESVRRNDIVIRWGGDEFVILLPGCHRETAIGLAETIRMSFNEKHFVHGRPVAVSIGVAELAATDDVASWLDRADRALYGAKGSGRNRAIVRQDE